MPDLTARVEEALLGALISDASQIADLPELEGSYFTDPARRAVWAAIRQLGEVAEGASGPEFADLIVASSDDPAITYGYLTQLALSAPTPGAASAYARMVTEATVTRDLAAATSGESPAEPAAGPSPRPGASYAACVEIARAALAQDMGTPGPAPAGERAAREEQYIAGIIRQQTLTDWITLNPEIFAAPGLRRIYQAVTAATRFGEPADELTLTWRAASIAAHDDYTAGRITTPETIAAAIPPGTIARLTTIKADPLTALQAGRDLLADDTTARIAAETPAARQTRRDMPGTYRSPAASSPPAARNQDRDAPPLLHPPAQNQLLHGPHLSQEGP